MKVIYSQRAKKDLDSLKNVKTYDKVMSVIGGYKTDSIASLIQDEDVTSKDGIYKDRVVGFQKDVIRIFFKVEAGDDSDELTILTIGNKKGVRGKLKEKKWLNKQSAIAVREMEKEKL